MTARNIYVHVHLPDGNLPVLAGVMTSVFTGDPDHVESAQAFFRYVPSYLDRPGAVAIDPFNLPLQQGRFETTLAECLLAFGVVRDAAPDSWGRGRMEREAGRRLDDVDFILASGEDRSGFLAFARDDRGPRITASWAKKGPFDPSRLLDLDGLAIHVRDAGNIKLNPDEERLLLLYGSSLGGARPKATVKYDGRVWLAKSPRPDDQYNYPRGEHAAMTLARISGMNVPETRIIRVMGRDVYLIERFDREMTPGGELRRFGFLSALSSFGISDNSMTVKELATYNALAKKIADTKTPFAKGDRLELFRRIVFNILVGNTDDHARNHGFLYQGGAWRLSPLYDVQPPTYRGGLTRHLAMKFGTQGGEGTITNLLSLSGDFGLTKGNAATEVMAMLDKFAGWRQVFSDAGVPPEDMRGYETTFSIAGELCRQANELQSTV